VLFIEMPVDHEHLCKTARQILYGIELRYFARDLTRYGVCFEQRMVFLFRVKVELSDEVLVTYRTEGQVIIFVETLQIGFDQRMKSAHLRRQHRLSANNAIEDLTDRSVAGGRRRR